MMSDAYFMNWQISAIPKPCETVCSKHPLRACMRAQAYTGETADGFAWFRTAIFCRFWILLSRITCPCAKTGSAMDAVLADAGILASPASLPEALA